jgi:hypothetical protein
VAPEELERAVESELRARGVVLVAVVAVEAVRRFLVDVVRALRTARHDLGAELGRDDRVEPGEVVHHRAQRRLVEPVQGVSAVIRDGRRHLALAGGKIGERTTPAVADGADAPRFRNRVHRGAHVAHQVVLCQRADEVAARLEIRVAQFHVRAHAVEEGRGDREETEFGVALGHATDVRVHAEDFLQHHEARARSAGGSSQPAREAVAIARCQGDGFSHVR